jgi:hypothetical protein
MFKTLAKTLTKVTMYAGGGAVGILLILLLALSWLALGAAWWGFWIMIIMGATGHAWMGFTTAWLWGFVPAILTGS